MSGLARSSDPSTSHDAGAQANTTASAREVLLILRQHPFGLTDQQVYARHMDRMRNDDWSYSESRLRTARCELVDAGLVEDSGTTAKSPRGRESIVWQVVSL